ncbi:MAG: LamG domain-containing protein [Tepidisphaeraceae bacterium]
MTLPGVGLSVVAVASLVLLSSSAYAQSGGDQIIDGIGETSLISRYPLDGTPTDRSRNSLSAKLVGDGTAFVDNRRGKVLALPGTPESALLLPAKSLADVESLSVVGWVRLRSTAADQGFIDFGKTGGRRLVATLTGEPGFRVGFTKADGSIEPATTAPAIGADRWTHIAVVYDAAGKTISAYVDGKRVGQSKPVAAGLEGLFDSARPDDSVLRVGANLNALVREFRLYSVPLTDAQVATIHHNATAGNRQGPATAPRTRPPAGPVVIDFGGPKLISVPDIATSTPVGQLPKLPTTVAGQYENGVSRARRFASSGRRLKRSTKSKLPARLPSPAMCPARR